MKMIKLRLMAAMAEKNFIEIKFENAVLAEGLLNAQRQRRLLNLAINCPLTGQKKVLGNLLRNGGCTLDTANLALDLCLNEFVDRHVMLMLLWGPEKES